MYAVLLLVYFTSAYPLIRGWRAVRHTSLAHAHAWAAVAWLTWAVLLAFAPVADAAAIQAGRYVGLCLIGCAGVAVLGARRPGVAAWNFVVLGLLVVLLLSWAEGHLTGEPVQLGGVRAVFLAGVLSVAILNYLPTRLALAALLLSAACGLEIGNLLEPATFTDWRYAGLAWTGWCLSLVPWAGWAALSRQRQDGSAVTVLWREFRDRYGAVWAQRLREQFNRSAANAGWPIELSWGGLEAVSGAPSITLELEAAALETLQALLKRFSCK